MYVHNCPDGAILLHLGILNACPNHGEPLQHVDTLHMIKCNPNNRNKCPNGYFCHQIGMFSHSDGYCCPGNGLLLIKCFVLIVF
jgi:hypothetical protein